MSSGTISPSSDLKPVVLVVDDYAPVLEVLRAGLCSHGFEVQVARNGREAIERFYESSQPAHAHVTLVLLDVQMPELDGPTVLSALQSIEPEVRAFFMTGDSGRYTVADLLESGAQRVFAKPLDIAAAAAEMRRSLVGSGPS